MIFSSYRDFSLYWISIQNQCNSIHMNKQKNLRMHLFGMTLLIWSLIGQFDFFAKSAENIFFYQHSISIWTSWALLTKNWWIHPPSVPLSENPCAQASKSKFPNTNNLSVNCYLKSFLYKGHNGFMLMIVCLDIKIVQFVDFQANSPDSYNIKKIYAFQMP